jgi:galactokinase
VARAPGRVNLLGGHVDYHEGPVLCSAIDRDIAIAFAPAGEGRIRVRSLDLDGVVDVPADGSAEPATVVPAWGRLVGGVVRSLAYGGIVLSGIDGVVASNLTIGGGLSSSAAFEVAVATALVDAAGASLRGVDLALACQSAEHIANGVPCGVQDQIAAVCGRRDHALLVDCRTLAVDARPLPQGAALVVVDSAVPRTLESSPWPQRRAEGLACAERLGLRVLRDATAEQVAGDPRGRHVVSEMQRVGQLADALAAGDLVTAGARMTAGHASLREDMEVSIPELDVIVDELLAAGAYGARLTGGGFGGCCIGLVPATRADEIAAAVEARYRARTDRHGAAFVVQAADGASIEDA